MRISRTRQTNNGALLGTFICEEFSLSLIRTHSVLVSRAHVFVRDASHTMMVLECGHVTRTRVPYWSTYSGVGSNRTCTRVRVRNTRVRTHVLQYAHVSLCEDALAPKAISVRRRPGVCSTPTSVLVKISLVVIVRHARSSLRGERLAGHTGSGSSSSRSWLAG